MDLIERLLSNVIIVKKQSMNLLERNELPNNLQFHNKLYESVLDGNYLDIKQLLLDKKNKTAQDYIKLSEIFGLEGNYKKKEIYLSKACKLDKNIESCKNISIEISGKILDNNKRPVSGAKIEFISNSTRNNIISNNDGTYTLKVNIHTLDKNRISFSKEGYATTFYDFTSFSKKKKKYFIPIVTLYKGLHSFTLNNIEKKDDFVLEVGNSKYTIPNDAFYLDGKKYRGEIIAHIYEFNKGDVPPSFLNLDAFSSDSGFTGTNMITSGMPYIVFRTKDGKAIHVRKDNPMVLEFRVPSITKLLEEGKITENFFNRSFEFSQKGKYILTVGYIIKNNLPLAPF